MSERKRKTERERRAERVRAALRWTEAEGPDLPTPPYGAPGRHEVRSGFLPHLHTRTVSPAWSEAHAHNDRAALPGSPHRNASQGSRDLYSTRERALRALRAQVERQAAEWLADLDEEIGREVRERRARERRDRVMSDEEGS